MSEPDPGASAPAGRWGTATVVEVEHGGDAQVPLVRLRLEVPDRHRHRPGQHCVVRLRAPDGYTAQRSYSIASDPADPLVELMVEALPDGEVSGHLHAVAQPGDVVEYRGPIGRWFTWDGKTPSLCVAGGTGVVPVVAMLRHARRLGVEDRLRAVVLAQTWARLPYAQELREAGAFVALTRENLPGAEPDGGERVAAPPYPDEVAHLAEGVELAYVCGSVGFASWATRLLGELGVRSDTIRVEQFGATG